MTLWRKAKAGFFRRVYSFEPVLEMLAGNAVTDIDPGARMLREMALMLRNESESTDNTDFRNQASLAGQFSDGIYRLISHPGDTSYGIHFPGEVHPDLQSIALGYSRLHRAAKRHMLAQLDSSIAAYLAGAIPHARSDNLLDDAAYGAFAEAYAIPDNLVRAGYILRSRIEVIADAAIPAMMPADTGLLLAAGRVPYSRISEYIQEIAPGAVSLVRSGMSRASSEYREFSHRVWNY